MELKVTVDLNDDRVEEAVSIHGDMNNVKVHGIEVA